LQLRLLLSIILMVALSLSSAPMGHSQTPSAIAEQSLGLNRSTSLTIKIVFLGITANELNSTYLTSNVTLPALKYQIITAGPLNTGVIYNFRYQLVFADNSTVIAFANYLKTIQQNQTTTPGSGLNPYFTNSTTVSQAQNYFYNANKVESWLGSNMALFGGTPIPGYTLFVADLHSYGIHSFSYAQYQASSLHCTLCPPPAIVTPHYYNRSVTDPDLGLLNTRHYMTGWGGSGRFYYLDLSAGPSYWTSELPVQVASQLRGVDNSTYYGKLWMSEFVGSYVFGAVYNLFAADQLYPVNYSQNYNIQLFVFDNRTQTEKSSLSLDKTINQTLIQETLASLVPFAKLTVNVHLSDITAYPALAAIVANATTHLVDPSINRPIVDGNLVYRWLTTNGLGHITNFVNTTRTTTEIDVPGFLFAFKGNYTFGVPVKEDIASTSPGNSFAGEALGDMVLIGLSQSDFMLGNQTTPQQIGKGDGFSHATIHELGHMMGLEHPFIYDQTEDFTDSVMGYYAYSLNYSQFDRDTILRGINDELLSYAQETLSTVQSSIFNSGEVLLANQDIADANRLYDAMNYSGAVPYSLAAAQAAFSAQGLGGSNIISPSLVFGLFGVAGGVGLGILLGYLLFRKRNPAVTQYPQYNRCPTCQQPLTWDPTQMRWYCNTCQKPI
jgi:hypothetical protein